MKTKKSFAVLLLFAFMTPSLEDGFNYYKALNRTPFNRIVRFDRDGYNTAFKVPLPLSKRLLNDEIASEVAESSRQQNDKFLSVLSNWFPRSLRSNDLESKEPTLKRCMDVRDVFSGLNE